MRKFIFIFLCICTVQAAPKKTNSTAKATPPLTVAERNKTLQAFQNFLKKPIYSLQDVKLFVYKDEEEITEVKTEPVEKVTKTQKFVEPPHDDLLVLRAVGKAIKPDGNMAANGQYVLCMNGYRILKAGDVLYAKFRGINYPITLKSVTRNQFTLELNKEVLTFQY